MQRLTGESPIILFQLLFAGLFGKRTWIFLSPQKRKESLNTIFTLRNNVYALMYAGITDAFFVLEFGRAQVVIRLVDLTWLSHIRIVSIKFSDFFRQTFMGSFSYTIANSPWHNSSGKENNITLNLYSCWCSFGWAWFADPIKKN